MVVTTTGNYDNTDELRIQVEALKAKDVIVYVIALGDTDTHGILRDLTAEPKGNTFSSAENFDSVRNVDGDLGILNKFTREICTISGTYV